MLFLIDNSIVNVYLISNYFSIDQTSKKSKAFSTQVSCVLESQMNAAQINLELVELKDAPIM